MDIPLIEFNHDHARGAGFEILPLSVLIEQSDYMAHNVQLPHRLGFYNFIFIEEGLGRHFIDFADYPYEPGSFIMVQKNQIHAFDFTNKPKGKLLLLTQDFLEQVQANIRFPVQSILHLQEQSVIRLDALTQARCQVLIKEMSLELQQVSCNPLMVMSLFVCLLLTLERASVALSSSRLSKDESKVHLNFLMLLEKHFAQTRNAQWYAQQCHVSYKTLNQVCKLSSQKTVKQCIDDFVILEAKRCLVLNQVNTQQLAYQLGFEDDSNFVKYFKKYTSLTPSQFQKQNDLLNQGERSF